MKKLTNEKVAYEQTDSTNRFKIIAYWADETNARIELYRDGNLYKEFYYPAYKIFNLSAHFEDIVSGELNNDDSGYRVAGSTGLGGCVMPSE